jgi:PAT family beta-lactamase induction signal transducer AmpG
LAWIRRPGAGVALAFILLYRIGDFAIAPMLKPFWVDRGMTLAEIATVSTTMGIVAGVVGALIGGFLTSRWGLIPGLWILGATQGLSNLVYWGVASYGGGRPVLYFAGIFESFAQGLATVAFVSLLMRLCDKAQAATQYALLSALYGLPRFIVGPVSGWATEQLGYPSYFLVTVLLSIPAFLFLPRLSDQVQRE